jgi:hypothetical protein
MCDVIAFCSDREQRLPTSSHLSSARTRIVRHAFCPHQCLLSLSNIPRSRMLVCLYLSAFARYNRVSSTSSSTVFLLHDTSSSHPFYHNLDIKAGSKEIDAIAHHYSSCVPRACALLQSHAYDSAEQAGEHPVVSTSLHLVILTPRKQEHCGRLDMITLRVSKSTR